MKNIIILCEVNDDDKMLFVHAKHLAKAFGSKIYLIHVVAPSPDFVGYGVGPQHERNWLADKFCVEHRKLQFSAEEMRKQGFDAKAFLLQGATNKTILEEADRLNAELIIVGNHQHGLFYRLFAASSVSGEVTQRAHCPVLLIPIEL